MMEKTKILVNCIFYSCIFLFFLVFFTQVHPLVPFDIDDWGLLSLERTGYPNYHLWNPTKILPECLGPIVGYFSAYCVFPIIGDYQNAIILTTASIVSVFITLYAYSVQRLIETKFNITQHAVFCIIVLFLLLHFLPFLTTTHNNSYLFFAPDFTCYFHYTIPCLFNAILVLWLMRHSPFYLKSNTSKTSLAFITYLALCSNLYASVILVAYSGALLIYKLLRNKNKLLDYINENQYYLFVIIGWLLIQLIEVNGSRATSYGNLHGQFFHSIAETINKALAIQINSLFVYFVLFPIFGYLLYIIINKSLKTILKSEISICLIFASLLCLAYLVLLTSKVDVSYLQRSDIIFPIYFFILLITILCIVYLCSRHKYLITFAPLLILFLFFEINNKEKTFRDVQYEYYDTPKECIIFNKKVINQIQREAQQNKDTIVIKIPKYISDDNWPLMTDSGSRYGITFYKHNLIHHKVFTVFELNGEEQKIKIE